MNQLPKRRIIIVAVAVLVVFFIYWIFISLKNPYGDELTVANLGTYMSGKPSDKNSIQSMQHNLFRVVNMNNKNKIQSGSVKDILIRDQTYSQTYDASKDLHKVHFVVDSKSLQQTYRVALQWVGNQKNIGNLEEYGSGVTCTSLDLLVYKNFDCVDDRILETGKENYDPVAKILPHHVYSKYEITDYTKGSADDKRTVLHVDVYIPRWMDTPDEQLLSTYRKELTDWLVIKKLDPNNYVFDFVY